MDIQKHLENSFNVIKSEPLVVISGGLVVVLLNLVSFGILSGPIIGGYLLMIILMLRDNRKPDFNDLFAGFSRFGQLFPFVFLSILIVIGFLFFFIPGIVMMTWWIFVLMLMVDKEMPLTQAMLESRMKVTETGFFMNLVFVFMITFVPTLLINSVAVLLPPVKILQILLIPFQCACLASLYLEQFGGGVETVKDGGRGDEFKGDETMNAVPPPPPPPNSGNEREEKPLPPLPPENDRD